MATIEFDVHGIVLDANENFLQLMGYTKEEIVGQHHRLFVHPSEAETDRYLRFWNRLARGEYFRSEFRRMTKSGREVWIEATYNPVYDQFGKPVSVIKFATDVTSKKRTMVIDASKLDAINRRFATIEFKLDGTIITANENFLTTMGYSMSEIEGRHHRIFVKPAYAESEEYQSFWQALRNGDFHSGLFCRQGKQGQDVYILASYNPIMGLNGEIESVIKYASDLSQSEFNRRKNIRVSQSLANSVAEVRGSIEQISANVGRTTELSQGAEALAKSTQRTAGSLGDGSRKIGKIIGVIEDLAEQTNLLALNASIESARAGEFGKGFAVVAVEVKTLAQQTAMATKGISETISDIQNCIAEVIDSTSMISERVASVNDNMATISTSVRDQFLSMSSVAESAKELHVDVET
jgi:methyl-accepting chemotaxis protein